MSDQTAAGPDRSTTAGCIALVIEPRARDIGKLTVRRSLPSRERMMVGPFIFFDHMGPADFAPGKGSGQNNFTIWTADPSRLSALLVI